MTIPATPKKSVPDPTNRDTAMTAITEGGSAEKSLSGGERRVSSFISEPESLAAAWSVSWECDHFSSIESSILFR